MSEYAQEAPEVSKRIIDDFEHIAVRARGLLTALWHESAWPEEYMPRITAGIVRIVLEAFDELEPIPSLRCPATSVAGQCLKPSGHTDIHVAVTGHAGCQWEEDITGASSEGGAA